MQTIKINGKEIKVSAGEERILRTLARSDFIAGKDNFVEGTGNHQRNLLQHANLAAIGVREVPKQYPKTNAEKRFFERNTRRQSVISGNKRRINAILGKLGGAL